MKINYIKIIHGDNVKIVQSPHRLSSAKVNQLSFPENTVIFFLIFLNIVFLMPISYNKP